MLRTGTSHFRVFMRSFFFRPQLSPGRTPSPMEYSSYNPSLIQQQYQQNIQPIMQQPNLPVATDIQQFSYQAQLPDQSQLHQPEPNLLMLNKVTPNQGGLQSLNNIGNFLFIIIINFDVIILMLHNLCVY